MTIQKPGFIKKTIVIALLVIVIFRNIGLSSPKATTPGKTILTKNTANKHNSPTSQPTSKATTSQENKQCNQEIQGKIDKILSQLEEKGKEIKTLKAKLIHQIYQIIPDDKQKKVGYLLFKAANTDNTADTSNAADEKKNAKFMVHFHTIIHDDMEFKRNEWYCFDGKWLREIRESTKMVIDRQIRLPEEEKSPFKLGKGPFPLPFGQSKEDILDNFKITLEETDTPNSDKIKLEPKKGTDFDRKYKYIRLWIDRTLKLPVKIEALDRHSNLITTVFEDIKINEKIPDSKLWLDIPKGYSYQKELLE